jgi:hypothetical protein
MTCRHLLQLAVDIATRSLRGRLHYVVKTSRCLAAFFSSRGFASDTTLQSSKSSRGINCAQTPSMHLTSFPSLLHCTIHAHYARSSNRNYPEEDARRRMRGNRLRSLALPSTFQPADAVWRSPCAVSPGVCRVLRCCLGTLGLGVGFHD